MPTPKKNTDLFQRIEECIDSYKESNGGASPSVREIADELGVNYSTVSRYLKHMREQGMIDYEGHRNITTEETKKMSSETVKVPVVGTISCGFPKYAEGRIEKYVRLPVELFGRGDFFILEADGDSMIEAGIEEGDLVLIRKQNYADAGQIVVALMGDEATLKRYYPEPQKRRIRLHPENSKLRDQYVSECLIQGVAVKVLKDLE